VDYLSFNGNLDTCITIRTAPCFPHIPHPACGSPHPSLRATLSHPMGEGNLPLPRARDSVQAGGGWVNDSEPAAEFQETVNKSKAMLKAVALAELFGRES